MKKTLVRVAVCHPFTDKYTGTYHNVGEIMEINRERAEELRSYHLQYIEIISTVHPTTGQTETKTVVQVPEKRERRKRAKS